MERIPHLCLLVAGASTGLVSIALVTFFRRIADASLRDLPAGETVVYAAVFAIASLVVARLLVDQFEPSRRRPGISTVAALVVTLVFLAGLSTNPVTVLSGLLTAATIVVLAMFAARLDTADSRQVPTGPSDLRSPIGQTIHDSDESAPEIRNVDEPLVELVRSNTANGERLAGSIRFETGPRETAKTLHVPLWPPLAGQPSVRCELDGIDGRVSVPFVKPHGFRIEVRLPEAVDEPLEGSVRFVAECADSSAAA